jgi:hypothetical protein
MQHEIKKGQVYNYLLNELGKPCICPFKTINRISGQDSLGRVQTMETLMETDFCGDHCPMFSYKGENEAVLYCTGRQMGIDIKQAESHPHEIGAGPDTPKIIMP